MPSFKDMMIEIKLLTSDTEMLIEEKQLLQQLQQLYLDEFEDARLEYNSKQSRPSQFIHSFPIS